MISMNLAKQLLFCCQVHGFIKFKVLIELLEITFYLIGDPKFKFIYIWKCYCINHSKGRDLSINILVNIISKNKYNNYLNEYVFIVFLLLGISIEV